jgi:hypothetical protein
MKSTAAHGARKPVPKIWERIYARWFALRPTDYSLLTTRYFDLNLWLIVH